MPLATRSKGLIYEYFMYWRGRERKTERENERKREKNGEKESTFQVNILCIAWGGSDAGKVHSLAYALRRW